MPEFLPSSPMKELYDMASHRRSLNDKTRRRRPYQAEMSRKKYRRVSSINPGPTIFDKCNF